MRRAHHGFTLVELITIMIILGILATVALPRLQGASEFRAVAFRDEVAAALRHAQKSAVAKRRLVCVTVADDSLTLAVATSHGVTACATPLSTADGKAAVDAPAADVMLTAAPAGALHFQPGGAATSDGAGTTPGDFTLTVSGQTPIIVHGVTGYVE